jgi:transcriptional regulator with XRE-family HTH domain
MIRFCCHMEKIDLPQWLRNELKKRDWSQVDLSRKTGISTTQIARILSGERGMGVETLVSIANAFGISPITIIRAAGLLPEGGEHASFEDWQFLLNQLPADEQEEVRKIVEMKIERRQKEEQAARAKQFKPKKV